MTSAFIRLLPASVWLFALPVAADNQFLSNDTANSSANAMLTACLAMAKDNITNQFTKQCGALWGNPALTKTPEATIDSRNIGLEQQAPQQVVANGTQATRLTAGQLGQLQGALDNRVNSLFARLQGTGSTMLASSGLNNSRGGGASADDLSIGPVGVWFNNSYNMGAVSSTAQQLGYDFGNYGLTLGADYKPISNLAVGTAFTYRYNSADFASALVNPSVNYATSLGNTETNSYTGTLYAAWYPVENFHVDANLFYGGNDYSSTRNINYWLTDAATGQNFWGVNTQAKGNTGGDHWGAGLRTGYNFVVDSLTIEPYGRFNYYALGVDAYQETGGSGLNLNLAQQNIESLITSLGSQVSYALSYQWGVLMPQFYAEWHHQFKDSQRINSASYVGDITSQQFGIYTTEPTRNFATVGTRLGGTFGHGLSAFVGYDAILGYANVNSQRVMLSGRLEF